MMTGSGLAGLARVAAARLSGGPRLGSWAYTAAGSRDYRLDLLRGFFVFAMVVDHIGGDSPLTTLTGNNQFVVSAAEGFVFISGLLMGIVYGGRVRKLGLEAGLLSVIRRAAFLYTTVVALTLSFVALFLFTEVPIWMERSSGLGVENPLQALVGTLTLHYSYHGSDILLIYVLLVGAAPIAFYLLSTGRTRYLLLGSWLLWAAFQVAPDEAQVPWPIHNSIFPFSAWQALFYTGLALGYHRQRVAELSRLLAKAPVLGLLAGLAAWLFLLSRLHQDGRLADLGIPGLTDDAFAFLFSKPSLGPGRVLAFFVLAGLAQQLVTRLWGPLRAASGWLLLPLGQKSLQAYGLHLFLIGPAHFVMSSLAAPDPAAGNAAVQVTALLLIWLFLRTPAPLRIGAGRLAAAVLALPASRAAVQRQVRL